MEKKLLFALDIGTRSIVGLIGEKTEAGIRVLGGVRQEHTTRAMLDGQIHDVPEVAKVIRSVRQRLEELEIENARLRAELAASASA